MPFNSQRREFGSNLVAQVNVGGRVLCGAILLMCAIVAPADAQQVAVSVGTVYAERKAISQTLDFVGRVEAIDRVVILARVKGYLEAVLFNEGDYVKKGDPLYRIEKGQYLAAVEQAQGALDRSKAA